MSRPMKWRNVCSLPDSNRFGPLDVEVDDQNFVIMRVDEYETIRLIDLEGLTQAECAEQMSVARTTVQGIYGSARIKLAKLLVDNKGLLIKGGEYRLCDGTGGGCGQNCQHQRRGQGMRPGRGRESRRGLGKGRNIKS